MATNPRKTPNDAALSAVEEALRLDFGAAEEGERDRSASRRPPEPRAPEPRPPAADANRRPDMAQRRPEASRTPAPPRRAEPPPPPRRRRSPRRPTPTRHRSNCRRRPSPRPSLNRSSPSLPPRPRAAEQRGRGRFAANDDRRAALPTGGYPRRPSRLIYPVAMGVSVLWAVLVISMGISRRCLQRRILAELARHAQFRPPPLPADRLLLGDRHHDLALAGDADRLPLDHRPRLAAVGAGEHRHRRGGQRQPGHPPRSRRGRRRHRARASPGRANWNCSSTTRSRRSSAPIPTTRRACAR